MLARIWASLARPEQPESVLEEKFADRRPEEIVAALDNAGGDVHLAAQNLLDEVEMPDLTAAPEAWFRHFDRDGSGTLSCEEVSEALKITWKDMDPELLQNVIDLHWERFDVDKSGEVDLEEFVADGGLRDAVLAHFWDPDHTGDSAQPLLEASVTEINVESQKFWHLDNALRELPPEGGVLGVLFVAHAYIPFSHCTAHVEARYHDFQAKGVPFRVLLVPVDASEAAYDAVCGDVPREWGRVPFVERPARAELASKLQVEAVPCLVLLDQAGGLITKDGRAALAKDPDGFPWTGFARGKLEHADLEEAERRASADHLVELSAMYGAVSRVPYLGCSRRQWRPTMYGAVSRVQASLNIVVNDRASRAHADTVPLNEDGYQQVVVHKSNPAMKHFVRRILAVKRQEVIDQGRFSDLIWNHSGICGKRTLRELLADLKPITRTRDWAQQLPLRHGKTLSFDNEPSKEALASAPSPAEVQASAAGEVPAVSAAPAAAVVASSAGAVPASAEAPADVGAPTTAHDVGAPTPVSAVAAPQPGKGKTKGAGTAPTDSLAGPPILPLDCAVSKGPDKGAVPGKGKTKGAGTAPPPGKGTALAGPMAKGKGKGKIPKAEPTRVEKEDWVKKTTPKVRWERILVGEEIIKQSCFDGAEEVSMDMEQLELLAKCFVKSEVVLQEAAQEGEIVAVAAEKKREPKKSLWIGPENGTLDADKRRLKMAGMARHFKSRSERFCSQLGRLDFWAIEKDEDFTMDSFEMLAEEVRCGFFLEDDERLLEQGIIVTGALDGDNALNGQYKRCTREPLVYRHSENGSVVFLQDGEWKLHGTDDRNDWTYLCQGDKKKATCGRWLHKDDGTKAVDVANYSADNIYQWDSFIEGFYRNLVGLKFYKNRLKALEGHLFVERALAKLAERASRIDHSVHALLNSEVFATFARRLLCIGNHLNAGDKIRNRADGFDVVRFCNEQLLKDLPKGERGLSLLTFLRDALPPEEGEAFKDLHLEMGEWPLLLGAEGEEDQADLGKLQDDSIALAQFLGDLEGMLKESMRDAKGRADVHGKALQLAGGDEAEAVFRAEKESRAKAKMLLMKTMDGMLSTHRHGISELDERLERLAEEDWLRLQRHVCFRVKPGATDLSVGKVLGVASLLSKKLTPPAKPKARARAKTKSKPVTRPSAVFELTAEIAAGSAGDAGNADGPVEIAPVNAGDARRHSRTVRALSGD